MRAELEGFSVSDKPVEVDELPESVIFFWTVFPNFAVRIELSKDDGIVLDGPRLHRENQ